MAALRLLSFLMLVALGLTTACTLAPRGSKGSSLSPDRESAAPAVFPADSVAPSSSPDTTAAPRP